MDPIALLKKDHRKVEALFKRFEKTTERASATRKKIVEEVIRELSVHATIEEQVLYPFAREASEDLEDLVLESLEEHHIVKWTLSELEKMTPDDERFEAKVTVLMESIRHHVEEEETELFPKLEKALDAEQLKVLGEQLEAARRVAPTRPHPRAPDAPPGNFVAGPVAGLMDRGRDLLKGLTARARKNKGGKRADRQLHS